MGIDLWAVDNPFLLAAPLRTAGYFQLGASVLLLLALVVPRLLDRDQRANPFGTSEAGLLVALLFIAPLAELLLVVYLPESSALPGVPVEPVQPSFSVLGSLPWIAAAGFMGVPQAALVAFAAGLARGGWITGSMMTPITLSLQAAAFAALLRLRFRETFVAWIRRPMGAALVAALLYGGLRAGELFAHTGGGLYDGLDFALSLLPAVMLAAVIEGAVSGVAGEVLRARRSHLWVKPHALIVGPYNRSLAARMLTSVLALGAFSVVVLASGQWLLARSAVRDLVADGMQQTAQQAGDAIPFFIQTGRSTIRDHASAVAGALDAEADMTSALAGSLRGQSFFSELTIFDPSGAVLASVPSVLGGKPQLPVRLTAALEISAQGVPQEVVVPPADGARGAGLVFLAPIRSTDVGEVTAVIGGWTALDEHPLLSPVLSILTDSPAGETYVIDERGTILLHPDPSAVMGQAGVSTDTGVGVRIESAPDGTRRLEYVYPVPGYPWKVVSIVPQRVVDQMAYPIAGRLVAVLIGVGIAFLGFIYWSSQRLTQPLRHMAKVAEGIARGDLDRPVLADGEDEVGRLAAAFERMRRSLKGRLDELNLLLDVSQSLSAELDLAGSLPTVLDGLRRLTGADVARLALASSMFDWGLEDDARQSGGDPDWAQLDGQMSDLCRGRGAFRLENPARARTVLDMDLVGDRLGSIMAEPVQTEDGYVGALWLGRQARTAFEDDDQNLLAIVTAQLGMWLSNVLLYQQAEEERHRLAAVLDVTPDAVIAVDRDGRITLANPAAESVLSVDRTEAVGMAIASVVDSEPVQELLQASPPQDQTIEVRLEDGRVLSASAREIWAGGWRSVGRVAVLWDITHYKKLDMLKSEFVSTVSHDLRAPLTLMRGYSTMISMVGALNEQQKEFVSKILDSVDGMAELVENLLDLGRIEAGMALELEQIEITDIMQVAVDANRPTAVNKKVSLEVELEGELAPMQADPTLLRQALANVIDNAIKYTPAGGHVTVRGRQEGEEIIFEIEDTGVGIAPADQSRLFERFYRARRPESLKTRGSGLGLAIVKSIVEQHGGRVHVESRLGAGSTFTLVLPLDPTEIGSDPSENG
ncbi:MAG: ATP-binding protein [Anaerolineales bacterium]